ncbi:prepilin-type N-terminal cleavage/methylation domain-containing protein [Patescibacteria group bacterium]|nr:prepilin-type N-terminal cleavage/methylation domain-containing protein [Patescibacteria group bacterium]MBU4023106.1 prepilin-type N-terminal cleavage/methylation domain-containing protein [Patescibacteria group bacterium]MBU4078350.1 prepilin-type N-terminal cleavage/methylation domain-containing protein [Patescibacteria group bacterium]
MHRDFKNRNINKRQTGFTLIEVLIAVFLTAIVFLGIFGGFQLAIKVTSQTKIKIQAVYAASQRIEQIRGLRFEDIETSQEAVVLNNISYNIQTIVETYDDCFDGTIEGFDCDGNIIEADMAPDDYKKVKVIVSWLDAWGGEIFLSTIVASKSMETGEGKGALKIVVSSGLGELIEIFSPDQLSPCPESAIQIINNDLNTDQCYGTSIKTPGIRILTLDTSVLPDDYKIIVQKQGYSRAETFKSGDVYNSQIIATPFRKNPTISQGALYPLTLTIDELSGLNIRTVASGSGDRFFDGFFDDSKIEEIERLKRMERSVILATTSPLVYEQNGYLLSTEKSPSFIIQWDRFSFSDFEELETDIKYQIFYATSSEWFLVPNIDLPGNSLGFDSSPVDLSSLLISEYSKLRVKGNFSTSDLSKTPVLYEWQISYKNSQDTTISSVNFDIRGEEIVGTNASEDPIYKYSENYLTSDSGEKLLSAIDPDNYYLSGFSRFGQELDLNTELIEMPVRVAPGEATTSLIYLESGDSLFVKVKDAETDSLISGAELELSSNSLGYNEFQTTNLLGDGLFLLLQGAGDYRLEVRAENYQEQGYDLEIWLSENQYINLERIE